MSDLKNDAPEIENEENKRSKIQDVGKATQDAYLEYAVSVIVDRALPDARDGLKPVHRRTLYAMNDLKISHTSAYKKSARIVGDTIGKYHPHGDSAVYDAMVRMAQPFSMRVPLVDGQGNFGSPDGDGAAAMRYTEARMGKFPSKYMFEDLFKDTVDFIPNYDGSEFEPSVFSLKYPNLVINGVQGIAVGMAASLPPHNPIEAMQIVEYKTINRIKEVEDSLDEMIQIMPAPDFPTGGHIHGLEDIKEAWQNGTGKVTLRAKWDEEELSGGRTLITITELPYQVKKADLVEKIEELIKQHPETKTAKVEGVQSIIDGGDKTKIIRLELVIKAEYDAELVMNELMSQTELQKTISYNGTVLMRHGNRLKPETLGLNKLFDVFIDHRLEVILKRSIYEDNKLAAREHVLNGLRKAIDPKNIDNVINTIRSHKDLSEAKTAIQELLEVDETQAQEILQIRLSRLVGMESEKIDIELGEIKIKRDSLANLIENDKARLNVILEESEVMVTEFSNTQTPDIKFYSGFKYPFRDRLSSFQVNKIKTDKATLTKEEECNIIITSKGYIRRLPLTDLSSMNRGARGKKQIKLTDGDFIQKSLNSHSHSSLLFITNTGKTYVKPAYDIPDTDKGRHVNWILELSDSANEKIIDVIPVDFEIADQLVAMFTRNGLVKVTKLSEYISANRKGGIKGITLRDNDSILCVTLCSNNDSLFMVNSDNLIIRFPVDNVTVVGRTASGVIGMKLDKKVVIVGAGQIRDENGYIVCVSSNGLIKVTKAEQYRIQTRSGKGLRVMKANERSGQLFNSFYVDNLDDDVVTTTKNGYSNSRPLSEYNVTNRSTTGVKLLTLEENDILVDVFNSPHQEDEVDEEMELMSYNVETNIETLDENLDDEIDIS